MAAGVLAAATLFGLLLSIQLYWALRERGEAVTWPMVLAAQLPPWYLWALFTPVVAWAGRRLPLMQRGWFPAALVHLGLAAGLTLARAGIEAALLLAFDPATSTAGAEWIEVFRGMLRVRMGTDLLAYAMILGVTSALDYHARFRERERTAARLSVQLTEARLQALRMQLNPHFLFNAMNSVAMLVRRERNAAAIDLIAGLGELLRYVLDESQPLEIPLRQELDFVEQYLAIERVRFPDRLHYTVDAAPDSLDALVPNLILQPLVENAVRHGIAKRSRAGRVEISARLDGSYLEVRVSDDGPGMDAMPSPHAPSPGVGLRNTRERLQRMYGERSRFRLESGPGGGTVATLVLPRHVSAVAEAVVA